ncbi:MAG TPA: sulfite oxidase [Blastocatellia bacterium]|nr:sulfite oxidase [Blastocatellia bacterium]
MRWLDHQFDFDPGRFHGASVGRRRFLARLAGLPLALGSGSYLARSVPAQELPTFSPNSPYSRAFNFASLAGWLTPNSQFFLRSHFGAPRFDGEPWTITVSGAVERERIFRIEDLLRMPPREEVVTLECAGNGVGMGMVSNARWAGVALGTLLKAAGLKPGATEVVLVGADGGAEREEGNLQIDSYARSIPVSKALDPGTLLAYKMNGEVLPPAHGGPVRALVSGWYGMDSVKWLKRIVVGREPFAGFYQTRRYYEARRAGGGVERARIDALKVKSQIARPVKGEVLHVEPVTYKGAAWSGGAEIDRVELSFDGGRTWREAGLGAERAPFAWRLWAYEWTPPATGRYDLMVRARDTLGRQQPLERDPLILTPYTDNRIERRLLDVR